jgi:hypothetical protein
LAFDDDCLRDHNGDDKRRASVIRLVVYDNLPAVLWERSLCSVDLGAYIFAVARDGYLRHGRVWYKQQCKNHQEEVMLIHDSPPSIGKNNCVATQIHIRAGY